MSGQFDVQAFLLVIIYFWHDMRLLFSYLTQRDLTPTLS